MNDLVMLI